ncbi:DUF454 domain-containing protein [Massilia cavernae]|uniref:DUF454 domain-containing protein n=2 Tax=Massilia cavernae TaxID=2320864 RepID=A0A418XSX5_9BURK|nr:DUF454 domain-containing protein [Massilia cavernae]
MKTVLNIIGAIAVVLGILGIFLPLLPTTPFLLLASACFARGSTRLHGWLLGNRVCGEYLRNYEAGRGIPARAKVTVLVLLWASIGYSATAVGHVALKAMLVCVALWVTIYLVRFVPTCQRSNDNAG